MKTNYRLLLIILITSLVAVQSYALTPTAKATKKTTGGLSVSVTTSTAGGNYTPRNIAAIWIEDNAGIYVKTLLVNAKKQMRFLTNWLAKNPNAEVVDASTGATTNDYGQLTGTWNGTDVAGNVVADGTYRVCMEMSDSNGTGNYAYFTFTKGAAADKQTPANKPSFSDISLVWTPK